ncbi:MAG: hypothetical protein NT075_34590 [Chloroflexi bacterium]|nr:hypothetical protein [Chloroflexota bacterium]
MSQPVLKRIYLDVCAICRPFDDQQQLRIRLETIAIELILATIRQTRLQLIVSPVHRVEINGITIAEEREQLLILLQQLGLSYEYNLAITRQRAEQLTMQGFGVADAAHLAFAEQAEADFISVDDRLLKLCNRFKLPIWYGTPLAYCEKENLR